MTGNQEKPLGPFEAMADYLGEHERNAPLHFAGRGKILNDLKAGAEGAARDGRRRGMTRVVEGMPGSGKTSIISEFIRRNQGDQIGERNLFVAELQGSDLSKPPLELVRTIHGKWLESGGSIKGGTAAGLASEAADRAARVLPGLSTAIESTMRSSGITERSGFGTCFDAFFGKKAIALLGKKASALLGKKASAQLSTKDAVIAVCIDEAQSCPVTKQAAANAQAMHLAQHNGRCAAYFFGLPGTGEWLEKLGLSRINRRGKHKVGLLKKSEARQAVKGTFDELGLNWASPQWREHASSRGFTQHAWDGFRRNLEKAIVDESADFPQHITLGLHAACEAFAEAKSSLTPSQGAAFVAKVRDDHKSAKADYYEDRLQGMNAYSAAFGAICKTCRELAEKAGKAKKDAIGSITQAVAIRAIMVGGTKDDEPIPKLEAREILQDALRKGALAKTEDDEIVPPEIPSLQTHLEGKLDAALTLGLPHAVKAVEALEALRPTLQPKADPHKLAEAPRRPSRQRQPSPSP